VGGLAFARTADPSAPAKGSIVTTVIGYHEVDDTDHRLSSPRRVEFFGSIGDGVRTFVNPMASTHVAVLLDLPESMSPGDLEQAFRTPEAAAAGEHGGVRVETLQAFAER
jgi:hypothetical protein